MAVELGLFRTSHFIDVCEKGLKIREERKNAEEVLIDLEKIGVSDEVLPLVKNVNTFISLKEYQRASEAADKIITEFPDSAAGWYAKALALSENFANDRAYKADADCGFFKYKQNSLKLLNDKNRDYITEQFNKYEKDVIFNTEFYCMYAVFNCVKTCLDNDQMFDDESLAAAMVLSLRKTVASASDEKNLHIEEIARKYPNNLIFCLYFYFTRTNLVNFGEQLIYYGAAFDDDPFDYYKNRSIKNMTLAKETAEEFFKRNGLSPERSTDAATDGFISYLTTSCKLLLIDPGDPKLYYSKDALREIEQLELEEEKRIAEEERLAKEEAKRREEEKQRLYAEQKAKERKKKIVKLSITAVIIALILCLISYVKENKDAVEKFFGISNYSTDSTQGYYEESTTESGYYIMASDCTAINLRKGPGTDYPIVTTLRSRSVKLTPTGKIDGDWIQVKNEKYGICWVFYNLVDYVSK